MSENVCPVVELVAGLLASHTIQWIDFRGGISHERTKNWVYWPSSQFVFGL